MILSKVHPGERLFFTYHKLHGNAQEHRMKTSCVCAPSSNLDHIDISLIKIILFTIPYKTPALARYTCTCNCCKPPKVNSKELPQCMYIHVITSLVRGRKLASYLIRIRLSFTAIFNRDILRLQRLNIHLNRGKPDANTHQRTKIALYMG